jgi:hypothetical protein
MIGAILDGGEVHFSRELIRNTSTPTLWAAHKVPLSMVLSGKSMHCILLAVAFDASRR